MKLAYIYFLICFIFSQLVAANIVISIQNDSFDESDQKGYFDKLFENRDDRLTTLDPVETFKKLKRLRDISQENTDTSSHLSPEQLKSVTDLTLLPELKGCDRDSFNEFTRLLDSERRSHHIVAYLEHYRLQLLRSCSIELGKSYYESVANLDPRIRSKILLLKNEVKRVEQEFGRKIPFYSRQALAEGIVTYLKSQNSRARGRKGLLRNYFDKIYGQDVEFLWYNLNENFKSTSLFFFDHIAVDGTLMSFLDEFTRDWIISVHICREASENREVVEEVYKLLKSSTLLRGIKKLAKTLKSN